MQFMGKSRDWGIVENTSHSLSLVVGLFWDRFLLGLVFFFLSRKYCFSIFPLPHCIRKARFHTFSFNQCNSTFTEDHMHKMFQNAFQK